MKCWPSPYMKVKARQFGGSKKERLIWERGGREVFADFRECNAREVFTFILTSA